MQHFSAGRFVFPSSPPLLADDDIHVWLLVLDDALKPREVTAAAHSLLGKLLMRYAELERAPEIARSERGKPYAPALAGIDFNLSHARDHVLIAIARGQPLGVDLERIDRRIRIEDLARRYFSSTEAEALEALPSELRLPAFLRLWTSKEAVLKALGAGISFGLEKVSFELDAGGLPVELLDIAHEAGPRENWQIASLEPAPGFLGALAWRGTSRHIRTFLADPTPDA
jgi:4'-phosphopantetheinyl transferase